MPTICHSYANIPSFRVLGVLSAVAYATNMSSLAYARHMPLCPGFRFWRGPFGRGICQAYARHMHDHQAFGFASSDDWHMTGICQLRLLFVWLFSYVALAYARRIWHMLDICQYQHCMSGICQCMPSICHIYGWLRNSIIGIPFPICVVTTPWSVIVGRVHIHTSWPHGI